VATTANTHQERVMTLPLKIEVGDRVRLKKPHPCGSYHWEVLRTGADIKARCLVCGRMIMVSRPYFERRIREFLDPDEPAPAPVLPKRRRRQATRPRKP
jgi:hypothetical protein